MSIAPDRKPAGRPSQLKMNPPHAPTVSASATRRSMARRCDGGGQRGQGLVQGASLSRSGAQVFDGARGMNRRERIGSCRTARYGRGRMRLCRLAGVTRPSSRAPRLPRNDAAGVARIDGPITRRGRASCGHGCRSVWSRCENRRPVLAASLRRPTTTGIRGRSSTRLRIRPRPAGRRNASRSQRARCPRNETQRAGAPPAETRSRCSLCLAFSRLKLSLP